mgnify:CR=1 FL=1
MHLAPSVHIIHVAELLEDRSEAHVPGDETHFCLDSRVQEELVSTVLTALLAAHYT